MADVAFDGSKVESVFTVGTSEGIPDALALDRITYLCSWTPYQQLLYTRIAGQESSPVP
jgi:hypothetical protein